MWGGVLGPPVPPAPSPAPSTCPGPEPRTQSSPETLALGAEPGRNASEPGAPNRIWALPCPKRSGRGALGLLPRAVIIPQSRTWKRSMARWRLRLEWWGVFPRWAGGPAGCMEVASRGRFPSRTLRGGGGFSCGGSGTSLQGGWVEGAASWAPYALWRARLCLRAGCGQNPKLSCPGASALRARRGGSTWPGALALMRPLHCCWLPVCPLGKVSSYFLQLDTVPGR